MPGEPERQSGDGQPRVGNPAAGNDGAVRNVKILQAMYAGVRIAHAVAWRRRHARGAGMVRRRLQRSMPVGEHVDIGHAAAETIENLRDRLVQSLEIIWRELPVPLNDRLT